MAETIPMLALSPTMERATIVTWAKAVGDVVAAGDVLCEVETDKAVMEYEAAADGVLLKILVAAGGECAVGDPIAVIGAEGEAPPETVEEAAPAPKPAPEPAPVEAPPPPRAPALGQPARQKISPLAARLAARAGLDVAGVAGSGPGGRIIKRDVEAALAAGEAEVAGAAPAAAAAPELGEQVIPISPKRKMIAERLSASKFSAPHYYLTTSVAMDELLAARRRLNEQMAEGEDSAQKVSLNAFLIAFAAAALARHPAVNATWAGETIRRHGRADVALAVAQADGLTAPVVRDCSRKGVLAIDAELRSLVARARDGTLSKADYADATFTITNLGSLGVEQFTAVINPPGSAILAVGRIGPEPVVDDDGDLVVRSMMRMTLSCDHRVIDGAVGAAFLGELKAMLENPTRPTLVVSV